LFGVERIKEKEKQM